ncbi:hypothetical protein F5051DRAFT_195869 [Lentinula edodes]|nr:hypothetical protein F5051DRAFT_195869 [Lentinula edodes]
MDTAYQSPLIATTDSSHNISSMFSHASNFAIYGGNFTVISATDESFRATGEWIFDLDDYKKWRSEPGVLWIEGPAGSGKTVLITAIHKDVQTVYPNAIWYHCFDTQDSTSLKTTYRGFLSSLVKQMGLHNEKISHSLYTLYQSNDCSKLTDNQLQMALDTMIKEKNAGYIIVDAIDECTEAKEVLEWLSLYSGQLWILVTSCNGPLSYLHYFHNLVSYYIRHI